MMNDQEFENRLRKTKLAKTPDALRLAILSESASALSDFNGVKLSNRIRKFQVLCYLATAAAIIMVTVRMLMPNTPNAEMVEPVTGPGLKQMALCKYLGYSNGNAEIQLEVEGLRRSVSLSKGQPILNYTVADISSHHIALVDGRGDRLLLYRVNH